MASKVNTVFVIVLCAGLIVLVGGFAAVYVLVINKSAAQYQAIGDDLANQGELNRAATNYLKGINQDQDNFDLIRKYIQTAQVMPVNTDQRARRALGNIQHLKYQATKYRRSDDELLEDYYQLLIEMARKLGPGYYDRLYEQADVRLDNDPNNLVAHKYRGIAQTQRLTPDLPEAEIQQALDDLTTSRKAQPEDAQVLYHIALWKLKEAARLDRPGGQPEKAKTLRQEAVDTAKAMYEVDPQSPLRSANYLRILLNSQINKQSAAKPVAQALENALLDHPTPFYRVSLAANALQRIDDENGLERSRRLIDHAVKANPNDPAYRVMLGQVLRKQDKLEDAYKSYQQAAKPLHESDALQWLRASGYQRQAIYQSGAVALQLAGRAKPQAKQHERWLGRAQDAVKKLEADSDRRSAQAQLLKGKIQLARDHPGKALAAFQRANKVYQDQNLQVLLGIADSAERLNEWGEAVDRIEAVLSRRPDIIPLRLRLVSILLERPIPSNQKRAASLLQQVLAHDPDNEPALRLQAKLDSQRGEFDKALAIYEDRLNLEQSPQLLGPRVRAYLASNQPDKARQLVRKQFEAHPTNLGLVQQLLRLTDDKQAKLAILAKASDAGADARLINLFKQQIRGQKVALDDVVDMIGQREDDPFAAALAEAKLYARAGRTDQARAALQRAIKLNPDSPRIIEIRFRLALAEQKYKKARKIIDQAAKINIDQAHGKFYQARLFAAQNKIPEAVATLRQALEARPIYSDGWRLLGSLLQRQDKHDQAIEALTKAIHQQPDDVQAMRRLAASQQAVGNGDQALQTIREAWANAPDNNQVFQQYVSMERAIGQPSRALQARTERAEDNPSDSANRRALALLQAKQDHPDQAMASVRDLLADQGRTRPNIAALASVYRLTGQPQAGLDVIEDYLAQRGDQATTEERLLKARYLGQIGRPDAMAQVYRQVIGQAGDTSQAVRREFAQRLFEQNQLGPARALYQQLHASNPDDLAITLRLAETMLRTGNAEQAKQLLKSRRKAGASVAGTLIRAMVARQDKDNAKALKILDGALGQTEADNDGASSNQPNKAARAMVHFQRGQILASQGDYEQAVNDLRQALDLNASMPRARLLLAESLIQRRRLDAAASELDQVLDRNPNNRQARQRLMNLYLSRGQTSQASNLLNDALKRYPKEPRWRRLQARLATQAGQTDLAEQAWRKALVLEAQPQVLSSLVGLLLDEGKPEQAISLLNGHPRMTASQPYLQALRGRGLVQSGQPGKAEQVFRRALERSENPSEVAAVTGQIQAAYQTPSQAASLMRSTSMASTSPTSPRVQELAVALARSELAAGAYDQALKRLRQVNEQVPADNQAMRVRVQRLIGMTLHQSGQLAKAKSVYESILDASPKDVRTLNNLAFLLTEGMGQPAQALPLAKRASDQAPSNVQVLDTLGWTQYKLGHLNQARQTLERTVRRRAIAPASYHLAVVLSELAEQARDGTEREQLRRQARATLRPVLNAPEAASNKTLRDDAKALLETLRAKSSSRSMEPTSP